MPDFPPAERAALIRKYFSACNAADFGKLVSCFTPNAVHYFPAGLPGVPWRGADTIARNWIWCVETLGSRWTIDNIICSTDNNQAVIEWTHWKRSQSSAVRGVEWYVFHNHLIAEIRAYYAAPADTNVSINELVHFDYLGRGYAIAPPED